jgi:hypothetical protein
MNFTGTRLLKTGRYPHCKTCGVAVNRERRQAKSAAESALGPVLGPTRKNVPRPGAGRPGRRNASDRLHANREWLTAEYQVKGRTATSLAEEAACAVSTITGYLHAYGITVRSSAELLRARRGELRPGTGIKGPAHYNWRGGKHSPCPDCGKPKAKRSKRCQTCAGVARRGVNALSWSGPDVGYAGRTAACGQNVVRPRIFNAPIARARRRTGLTTTKISTRSTRISADFFLRTAQKSSTTFRCAKNATRTSTKNKYDRWSGKATESYTRPTHRPRSCSRFTG